MKLSDYLKQEGIRQTIFARRIGVNINTLHNILKGYDTRLSVALSIEEVTRGSVKPKDLAPTKKRSSRSKKEPK